MKKIETAGAVAETHQRQRYSDGRPEIYRFGRKIPARDLACTIHQRISDDGRCWFRWLKRGFQKCKKWRYVPDPDLDTAFMDPFWERTTISMLCDIVEADSRLPFMGDPRSVAKRTLDYAKQQHMAEADLYPYGTRI